MKFLRIFAVQLNMVPIVQLVRASDCGSECRGFESHWAPKKRPNNRSLFFVPAGFEPDQQLLFLDTECKIARITKSRNDV